MEFWRDASRRYGVVSEGDLQAGGMVEGEQPVEIVVPRGQTPDLRGVVLHQTRDPIVIAHRCGLPVTTPMRALVDLGAVVRGRAVEDALDRGLVLGLYSIAAVEWERAGLARPGRRGSGVLGRVLDRRALEDAPPDGMLEPRFARLRRTYDLPPAEFQWKVIWESRTYYIDFAYPELKIAIEVDGYYKRATRAAFETDTRRQTDLGLLGWTVLRFTWRRIVKDPAGVARDIRIALGAIWPESRLESRQFAPKRRMTGG